MRPSGPPKTLGERLAQARRELAARLHRDVTQGDLAEALGVGAATISRWEADLASPREDALENLALVLGVGPAYLRYGVVAEPHHVVAAPEREMGGRAWVAKQTAAKRGGRKKGNGNR